MSKASPLSGLLDAAFGNKASEAAVVLNNMGKKDASAPDTLNDELSSNDPSDSLPSTVERSTAEHTTVARTSVTRIADARATDIRMPVERTTFDRSQDTGHPQERRTEERHTVNSGTYDSSTTNHPTVNHDFAQKGVQTTAHRSTFYRNNLTQIQESILSYLISLPMQRASRIQVSETLGIPPATVRDTIKRLDTLGFFSHRRACDRNFQGFEFTINQEKCDSYFSGNIRQTVERNTFDVERPYVPLSSSSLKEKHTTSLSETSFVQPSDVAIMLQSPEHGFWREAGIMPRQVETWMRDTGMSLEQIDMSLKHCRFSILNKNGEEVRDPLSWFWKTIQRTGFYPRPEGYKSLEELRAEEMQKIAKEQAAARRRRQMAELEIEFERLVSDPTSDEYKAILEQLPEFSRNLKGMMLEKTLRAKFFENAGFPLEGE